MLVQALEHRPHGDDLGDDAEDRADGKHRRKPTATGMPMPMMNSEPSTPPSIPSVPAVKLEHARGGEHHVIGDTDQCVDAADRHPGQDDRFDHRLKRCSREPD